MLTSLTHVGMRNLSLAGMWNHNPHFPEALCFPLKLPHFEGHIKLQLTYFYHFLIPSKVPQDSLSKTTTATLQFSPPAIYLHLSSSSGVSAWKIWKCFYLYLLDTDKKSSWMMIATVVLVTQPGSQLLSSPWLEFKHPSAGFLAAAIICMQPERCVGFSLC